MRALVRPCYFIWATMLVLGLVVIGLAQRFLAVAGMGAGACLVVRGLACFLGVAVLARRKSLSLLPNSPRRQLVQALVVGLALSFFTLSYKWLTASVVAVLSNIDVPVIIFLGPWIGVAASLRLRALALLSISFLVVFVVGLEVQPHLALGLGFLLLGSVFLCVSYFFMKRSIGAENEAVVIATPALAIVGYGLVQMCFEPSTATWTPTLLGLAVLAGAGMFGAYFASMKLYSLTDLASAEFPTLISSIAIQPLERIFLGTPIEAVYLGSALGFAAFTYFVLKLQTAASLHGACEKPL